ncbi:MAG: hypothetical protein ACOZE5_07515 [Verrucomicrobiota bacterium]
MKPAGHTLLLYAGLVASALADEPSSGLISRDLAAKIREGLPAYQPPPPGSGGSTDVPPQTSDPEVLVLPKFSIKEKRLPRDAADHLMSRDDFKRKMENLYLDTIAGDGPLNYFLNRFTIPILSPSKAERGRMIYKQRELDRLRHVTGIGGGRDSTKQMERELDNTHTTRPAGGLQKR